MENVTGFASLPLFVPPDTQPAPKLQKLLGSGHSSLARRGKRQAAEVPEALQAGCLSCDEGSEETTVGRRARGTVEEGLKTKPAERVQAAERGWGLVPFSTGLVSAPGWMRECKGVSKHPLSSAGC